MQLILYHHFIKLKIDLCKIYIHFLSNVRGTNTIVFNLQTTPRFIEKNMYFYMLFATKFTRYVAKKNYQYKISRSI